MSKYTQGISSVKEVKNAEFFASLSVAEAESVKKKTKSKKKSSSKQAMMELLTASIGAISLLVVAIIELRSRKDDSRWALNTKEHEALVERVEDMGTNLGRSIDRVETNMQSHLERIENKIETHDSVLFEHLASHAELRFNQEASSTKRRRSKQYKMGKKRKKVARGAQQRERRHPITGAIEVISGTKAGKRRMRLPSGHPLRTHDLFGKKDIRTD